MKSTINKNHLKATKKNTSKKQIKNVVGKSRYKENDIIKIIENLNKKSSVKRGEKARTECEKMRDNLKKMAINYGKKMKARNEFEKLYDNGPSGFPIELKLKKMDYELEQLRKAFDDLYDIYAKNCTGQKK